MTLEQFLAMLRGAQSADAQKSILAGLTAAQRAQINPVVTARARELGATENRTADQNAELAICLDAAEAMVGLVAEDNRMAQRISALAASDAPAPNPALRVATVNEPNPAPGAPGASPQSQEPSWRTRAGQSIRGFGQDAFITRSIASDLTAHGVSDQGIDHLASREYADEVIRWMRSCASNPNGTYQSRALNEVTIDGGGAVVPLDFIAEIIQRRASTRRVSSLVRRYQTSRETLTIPKFLGGDSVKINDLAVQWAGAEGAASEDTSLEAFGNVEIKVHRGAIIVIADRAWLEDAAFDMEGWVIEQITDMYEAMLDQIIVSGSGVGRPFGLQARTGTTTPAAGLFTCDNLGNPVAFESLVSQQGALSAQYAQNATYLWQRLALYTQVLGMKATTGQPIMGSVSNTAGGALARVDTQLLGVPVVQSDYMSALGAGNKINYYGDFRQAYGLVERVTLQIEPYVDPAIQKKDQRGWYVRFRIGGDRLAEWALRCGLNT